MKYDVVRKHNLSAKELKELMYFIKELHEKFQHFLLFVMII
jgi:hypothetical protein